MLDKILIVGMGSAGRRYLRLVKDLGATHVDVLRSGKSTIKEDLTPIPDNVYVSAAEAFKNVYDAVIVCTPSSLHYEYIKDALKTGSNVLTEKPVSNILQHLFDIKSFTEKNNVKFAVCHNLRYHPIIKGIKKHIEDGSLGAPICASAQFCAYLPDWHPWEDYKGSYAANNDLGGGAALTHIHEVDYLNWLFGKPIKYNGIKGSKKFIGTDTDECSVINIEHDSGVISQLLLTLNTKPPKRNLTIFFTKGRIEVDLIAGKIIIESGTSEALDLSAVENNPADFNFENTYKDMLTDFDRLIRTGSSDLCTIDDAIESTKIVTEI